MAYPDEYNSFFWKKNSFDKKEISSIVISEDCHEYWINNTFELDFISTKLAVEKYKTFIYDFINLGTFKVNILKFYVKEYGTLFEFLSAGKIPLILSRVRQTVFLKLLLFLSKILEPETQDIFIKGFSFLLQIIVSNNIWGKHTEEMMWQFRESLKSNNFSQFSGNGFIQKIFNNQEELNFKIIDIKEFRLNTTNVETSILFLESLISPWKKEHECKNKTSISDPSNNTTLENKEKNLIKKKENEKDSPKELYDKNIHRQCLMLKEILEESINKNLIMDKN